MGRKINNMIDKELFTIGVEEEFMICNPDTYELSNKASSIMDYLSNTKEKDRFSYELLLGEIEANTPICRNVSHAMEEVSKNRRRLRDIGNILNFRIGISGTHPTAIPTEQEFVNNESYNWVKSQLNEYARENITFSTHVHIGLKNNEDIIQATNIANGWIAPFLALSVNSPFFSAKNTGMLSARTLQFGIFPRTNVLHKLNSYNDFEIMVEKLKISEAIEKPRHLWWKIRPHIEFNTVEFRICDVQRSLVRTEMFVAFTQALVHRIYYDIKDGKTFLDYNMEFINDGIWKAARSGLNSNIISPINEKNLTMIEMVYSLLEYIRPSLVYFGTEKNIEIAQNIIVGKTEAVEQIDMFNEYGFKGLNSFLVNNVQYE